MYEGETLGITQEVKAREFIEAVKLILSLVDQPIIMSLEDKSLFFSWSDGFLDVGGLRELKKEARLVLEPSVLSFITSLKVPSATSTFEIEVVDNNGAIVRLGSFSKTIEACDSDTSGDSDVTPEGS